jgi:dUTP pyrophosphatase
VVVLEIQLVRLDEDLPTPGYARLGDAGCDLFARVDTMLAPAGGRATIATGIALQIPEGYAGLVLPRSGLAARHGITCLNSPGLIDPGYRGEVAVILVNTDPTTPYEVHRGDRIAQLVISRVEEARFLVVEHLETSERGPGGFGHSGR